MDSPKGGEGPTISIVTAVLNAGLVSAIKSLLGKRLSTAIGSWRLRRRNLPGLPGRGFRHSSTPSPRHLKERSA
jgi:hypothetical protein